MEQVTELRRLKKMTKMGKNLIMKIGMIFFAILGMIFLAIDSLWPELDLVFKFILV